MEWLSVGFSFVSSSYKKNLLQAKFQLRNFAQKLIGFPNSAMSLVHLGCNLSEKKSYRPIPIPPPPSCKPVVCSPASDQGILEFRKTHLTCWQKPGLRRRKEKQFSRLPKYFNLSEVDFMPFSFTPGSGFLDSWVNVCWHCTLQTTGLCC